MPPTGLSASTGAISHSATVYSYSSQSTIWTPVSTETISDSTITIYSLFTQSATWDPISTEKIPTSITTTVAGSLSTLFLSTLSSSTSVPSDASTSTSSSSSQGSLVQSTTTNIPVSDASTISASSTSIPSHTPELSPRKLSAAEKAGIAIGAMVLLAVLPGIFLFFRRNRQRLRQINEEKDDSKRPTHEIVSNSNRYELITKANTHEIGPKKTSEETPEDSTPTELITKANVHEIGQDNKGEPLVETSLSTEDSQTHQGGKKGTTLGMGTSEAVKSIADAHELDPDCRISQVGLGNTVPTAFELENSAPALLSPQLSANVTTGEPPSPEEENRGKMQVLQDRMEKIREEKERLEKIQELQVLEEETKKQILEEAQRRRERNSARGQVSGL